MINNTEKSISRKVHICLLNEFRFQNGLIPFHCLKGLLEGIPSDVMIGMINTGRNQPKEKTDQDLNLTYPIVIHPNYCDDKKMELMNLGLWLSTYDSTTITSYTCKPFLLSNTIDGQEKWINDLKTVQTDLQEKRLKYPHYIYCI